MRWGKEELLKRELDVPPCCHTATFLASTLGQGGQWQVAWRCMEPASRPPLQPPAQGQWTHCLLGHSRLLGPWGGVGGGSSNPLLLVWGEGFLFSVPAVFLLFNLNTQPLHHSCIPGSGRGLWWQLPTPAPPQERLGELSFPSLLFREQSFLCAADNTGEQSWVQVLKSQHEEGALRCFWVWDEQAHTDGECICTTVSFQPPPHPSLASQCVKCNELFKINSFHPCQFGAYPSSASLPLCPSCLNHELSLRRKVLG
ncbi:LOW QUALITY PROTEIN: TGFB1-induced anti-apoptotic factor 1 [Choloepus didactylus]|uniref:LOW QUALITY PROTEIN: TGFB1-induced anti-apoptotic factor 1 n=1 Tax=Choloepus didactylus TaxID=27675 RepID=UPI00189DCCF7|nr:LOW QUALITY PROTEIN: TGFB1-induced anti-apoptotic factor 1 [Choloepus didactylus]